MPATQVPESLEAVLAHAWGALEFTAAEAMAATGLTRSTTIEALDRLIALGLLRELPNAREVGQYRKGRPSRRFELRSDASVVVGVDAGRFHLTTVVADLRGAVLAHESVTTDSARDDPDARRGAIEQVIDAALAAADAARADVLAVCVGVPAPVDSRGASPVHNAGFWQTMNPGLQELLSAWAPIVRVENDAALAAVAEGVVGAAASSSDFTTLLAGERIGIGVVVDGHLLRGAHGGAGESIALRLVSGVETERGFGDVLARWARADAASGAIPARHPLSGAESDDLTAPAVLELAAAGDTWASGLVERAGALLARIAALMTGMYDPERIVVSGAVAEGLGVVVEIANGLLPGHLDGPAPTIVASPLGADVVATGAVMGAVEAARTSALGLMTHRARATHG